METRFVRTFAWIALAASSIAACSDSEGGHGSPDDGSPDAGTGSVASGSGGGGGTVNGAGGSAEGGTRQSGGEGGVGGGGGTESPPTNGVPGGQIDAVFPKAEVLPRFTNVVATLREDSVAVDFDPVDGAVDYRIFPLPEEGDVTVDSGGVVVVRDATYRCAGTRQGWDAVNNLNESDPALARAQGEFSFEVEVPAEPTLGYVFVTSADDRTPVYALAGYSAPPEYGWRESRLKIYTTDEAERTALLAEHFRDDGIAFYVPKDAAGTKSVFRSAKTNGDQHLQYYFGEGEQSAHADDETPPAVAFPVLAEQAEASVPLMAVFYKAANPHTELAAGKERFQRAAYQGNSPLWHVEWSGITEKTVLVLEALATGCPFQGMLSATHLDASPAGEFAAHQALLTPGDMRAASATGEVFVNGQYDDVSANPKAIARSFIQVEPRPHDPEDWDYYQGFSVGTELGDRTPQTIDTSKCWQCERWTTPLFDIAAYNVDHPEGVATLTFGNMLGQLWLAFDDWAQDVTGKLRFTALEKASIDADAGKYLHVTASFDIVSTGRRYPQLILSDQDAPVQEGFSNPEHDSLIVQPIGGPSSRIELQAIHGLVGSGDTAGAWDVNNQAPAHVFIDFDAYDDIESHRPPMNPAFEHSGVDRLTRFDVFASSERLYLFVDGEPAGCTRYPANVDIAGPVTVTLGAVLYHEGATDEMVWAQERPYGFWHRHEATETKRHFDDLAWKSGVAAPSWDDARFPCAEY